MTIGRPLYDTERGAKIALTRGCFGSDFEVVEYQEFLTIKDLNRSKKTVKTIFGKEVQIDSDTPYCCDPSCESFWCN